MTPAMLDGFFAAVLLISMLVACFRGLIREVFTIIGLVVSSVAGIKGGPLLVPFYNDWLKGQTGCESTVGVTIVRSPTRTLLVSTCTSSTDEELNRRAADQYTLLAPHLKRAFDFLRRRKICVPFLEKVISAWINVPPCGRQHLIVSGLNCGVASSSVRQGWGARKLPDEFFGVAERTAI